jgi:hypothetical protein
MGNDLEIYNQRYETFRHLDALRWQWVNTIIALLGLLAALPNFEKLAASTTTYFLVAMAFFLLAFTMYRTDYGYRKNGMVLYEISKMIGDASVPDVNKSNIGAYRTMIIAVVLIGFFCLFYAEKLYFQ